MLCANPITVSGLGLVGCGQCMQCRINRKRVWVHRILLESGLHEDNAFVTLTYTDAKLPRIDLYQNTLVPADLRNFLKRLRKAWEPLRFRFFAVGEYGDASERAHFHLALFQFPTCMRGRTLRVRNSTRPDWANCCPICKMVGKAWGNGDVDLGGLTEESASYVAGYVTKKMTGKNDARLNGRHPEFARMSNRPGIGADAMHDVASTVLEFNLVESQGDVPSALRRGKRILPLGRYLRRRLRKYATGSEDAPEISKAFYEEEYKRLQAVQMAPENARKKVSLKEVKLQEDKGRIAGSNARYRLFKKGKTL